MITSFMNKNVKFIYKLRLNTWIAHSVGIFINNFLFIRHVEQSFKELIKSI